MRIVKPANGIFVLAMFGALILFCASPGGMEAQTCPSPSTGNNIVYAKCSGSTTTTGSTAFLDASAFSSLATATDLCSVLNYIYKNSSTLIPSGGVIDARGIAAGTCAGVNPWATGASSPPPPTTVLLPTGTTTISVGWILPTETRIYGASRTNTSIAAASGFTGTMIEMGSNSSTYCPSVSGSYVCNGVVISDLEVDGGGLAINGIQNQYSQDGSYVSRVTFHWLESIALDIETSGANNSGPYTDLTPSAGGSCDNSGTCTATPCTGFDGFGTGCTAQNSNTACIKIGQGAQTRGIHGFTCTAGYLTAQPGFAAVGPNAGVYLDGSGNTIEDGHFEGVKDGIVVGDSLAVTGNVIRNITGASSTGGTSGFNVNVIHICNPSIHTAPCSSTMGGASDLTLTDVQTYTTGQNVLQDDETGPSAGTTFTVNGSGTSGGVGAGLGLYVLGEGSSNTYSRFNSFWFYPSNSTSVPIWGYAANTTETPTSHCAVGSVFSNGGGSSGSTVFVCVGTATPSWVPIA